MIKKIINVLSCFCFVLVTCSYGQAQEVQTQKVISTLETTDLVTEEVGVQTKPKRRPAGAAIRVKTDIFDFNKRPSFDTDKILAQSIRVNRPSIQNSDARALVVAGSPTSMFIDGYRYDDWYYLEVDFCTTNTKWPVTDQFEITFEETFDRSFLEVYEEFISSNEDYNSLSDEDKCDVFYNTLYDIHSSLMIPLMHRYIPPKRKKEKGFWEKHWKKVVIGTALVATGAYIAYAYYGFTVSATVGVPTAGGIVGVGTSSNEDTGTQIVASLGDYSFTPFETALGGEYYSPYENIQSAGPTAPIIGGVITQLVIKVIEFYLDRKANQALDKLETTTTTTTTSTTTTTNDTTDTTTRRN